MLCRQGVIARIRQQLNQYALAQKSYEYLIKNFPKSKAAARAFLDEGREKQKNGDVQGALQSYRNASESFNGLLSAEAQKLLADCYFNLGQYKEATVEYLKTVYLFREYPLYAAESQYMAGKSCELQKQYREATNAYKRTKEFFPSSEWAGKSEISLNELKQDPKYNYYYNLDTKSVRTTTKTVKKKRGQVKKNIPKKANSSSIQTTK